MITRWIQYLLICTIGLTNAFAADEPNYPPPPTGVNWGWQAEIMFNFDSASILKEEKVTLDQIAATLNQYTDINVLITGRADNYGNIEYNRKLSTKRANAISNYLVKAGVAKRRIMMQAMGEERPVTNNACPEDRKRNRRVDLAFFPNGYEYTIETPETVRNESQPRAGECEELKEKLQPRTFNRW